jgi:outer membrane protein assembly factor BamB
MLRRKRLSLPRAIIGASLKSLDACGAVHFSPPILIPMIGSPTTGAFIARSDPSYPLRSRMFQRNATNEVGKGRIVTTVQRKWVYDIGGDIFMDASIADIDGDKRKEIVCRSNWFNYVWCFTPEGGLKWRVSTRQGEGCFITVWDVDRDGKFEIFLGDYAGYFWCLNYNGSIRWSIATPASTRDSEIVVYDVDGDGQLEVLFGRVDGMFYCLDCNGNIKWYYSIPRGFIGGNAVADVDGDGIVEVIFTAAGVTDGGYIYCLRGTDGSEKWRYALPEPWVCALFDVDRDGKIEIIVGGGDGRVYCLNPDGTLKWSSTAGTRAYSFNTIGIYDIDGDGCVEILVQDDLTATLYCLRSDGTLKWSYAGADWGPTVADVDGDGKMEVIFPYDIYLIILEHDGTLKVNHELDIPEYADWLRAYYCAMDDIDGDGYLEIILPGDYYLMCVE